MSFSYATYALGILPLRHDTLNAAYILEMLESPLFQEIRKSGVQGRTLVGDAELEHEEIKSMILTWQQSEGDDDQAWDEFFEDIMQTVRASFTAEERDLLPLLARSLNS